MSRILISTDTTADLSKEIVDARGIKQLSLHVLLGEQEYIDGINISPRDIFDYVEKTHVLPKTSAAGIPEYTEFFAEQLKEYDSIIHFTISAELSSTFDNAQSASEQFNGKLSVVDSRNLSTGQGLLVLKACDLRDVGDKITINAETNGKSPLVGTEFTVTAIVEHPSYLRNENDYSRGFCGIGDGSVDYYAVASEKAFNREAYDYSFTQLLIKSEELDGLETFGDEYGEKASTIANRIKEVGSVRAGSRSDEIAAALDEKLAQARSEFAEKRQELVALRGKAEALYNRLEKTDELLKSYIAQPTEETLQAIADEVAQIFAENPDLVSQIVPAANEIGRLLEEYLKNPDSLTEKERKVVEQALDYMNLSKDAEGVAQLKDYLETAKSFAENYEKDPEGTLEALHGLIMMAVSLSPDLAGAEEKLCEKLGKVRGQIGAIDAAIAMLDELQGEKTPLATYSSGLIENAGEYTAKLEEAISQYRAALETRRNLVRYENWSVQKRTDNAGVVTAKYNAESSKKLCYTMSLLFVFVGMMVCYTTVSRNINESQVATGVQKALGFRGREILAHYTCYSVIAVLLGSLLGYALGYFVIETIVNHAYAKLYVFPYLPNTFTVPEALIITLVEIVLVCIATWLPCRKLLKRKAVELIRGDRGQNRPKAYWKLKIWKRLSLYTQTTINNLFGDGSRVIATLVGIAGCTALIVMSMSLRFSIVSTPEKHFSDIWVYDAFLVKDASVQNSEQNLTEVLDGEACDYIRVRRDVVYIEDENGSF
ncbi:MAG: DegV family protein, partial [Candidatus Neoclostridium sp.]